MNDRFRKFTAKVHALQVHTRTYYSDRIGVNVAEPGDWLIQSREGHLHKVSNETFRVIFYVENNEASDD